MKDIYVSIDSVFDLRHAAISILNEEMADNVDFKKYHLRKCDIFEGIDKNKFDNLIEKHGKLLLINSLVTNIFEFLYNVLNGIMKEIVLTEMNKFIKPTVCINIWPFELTEEEIQELRVLSYIKLKGIIGVEIINKDIKDLTPASMEDKYQMVIMYRYDKWINIHNTDLTKHHRPKLLLIGPAIFFEGDPDKTPELITQMDKGVNLLLLLEAGISPIIMLKLINVDVFSIAYPEEGMLVSEDFNNQEQSAKDLEIFMKELEEKRNQLD